MSEKYEKPICTIDVLLVTLIEDVPHVMIVNRKEDPYKGKWSLLGGFVFANIDKDLNDTVNRVLERKIGVTDLYYEQLETTGSFDRDPRGWSLSVSYAALIPWEQAQHIKPTNDITEVKWRSLDEIRQYELAFDHNKVVETGFEKLKTKINYSTLPLFLLPEYFTITEFQNVYEIFLGKKLDKSGFRKKIKDIHIIETDKKTNKNFRPAKLFTVDPKNKLQYFRSNIL